MKLSTFILLPAMLLSAVPASAAGDDLLGKWVQKEQGYFLEADIRRGSAKPEFLVADVTVVLPRQCVGNVTVYGKPDGSTLVGESYDPKQPEAPVCRLRMSRTGDRLTIEELGSCSYWHGAGCDFSGEVAR
ncbi:hypothetical protein [Fulvimarina sp. MAC8]|uniref:hypothetical protein n=1 Tax=Fulvimarina sp. MAC8 TaxID=3162874 RepID=UPI0032EF3D48